MADHREVVRRAKVALGRVGFRSISVRRGRGTAWGYIEFSPACPKGEYRSFTPEESEAIRKVFGISPGGNFACALDEELEMVLGMRQKKPICSICGSTYLTEEAAAGCIVTH